MFVLGEVSYIPLVAVDPTSAAASCRDWLAVQPCETSYPEKRSCSCICKAERLLVKVEEPADESASILQFSTFAAMSQEQPPIALDALSYIDKDYDDPRVKDVVHSLIEEEMAAFDPPDYLADKPAPKTRFHSPILKAEWTRVRAGQSMMPMDTSRYDLQPPQGAAAEDETTWKHALNNVRAQTEHQHNRLLNLELLQNYGASMWLGHNKSEEGTEAAVAAQAKRARNEAEEVNIERKTSQEDAERTLWNLARKRSDGFAKNLQIQLACETLRAEVKRLKTMATADGAKGTRA